MDNFVVEKIFLKENEGVRVNSNDFCAIFLLNDFELNQFISALKKNTFTPTYQSTPVEIYSLGSEMWNVVICFQRTVKKISFNIEKIESLD